MLTPELLEFFNFPQLHGIFNLRLLELKENFLFKIVRVIFLRNWIRICVENLSSQYF